MGSVALHTRRRRNRTFVVYHRRIAITPDGLAGIAAVGRLPHRGDRCDGIHDMERMVQRLSPRQLELCPKHADGLRDWHFAVVAVVSTATCDSGRLQSALALGVR